jgi:hypothetical protein
LNKRSTAIKEGNDRDDGRSTSAAKFRQIRERFLAEAAEPMVFAKRDGVLFRRVHCTTDRECLDL